VSVSRPVFVVPADAPTQIGDSPHLGRLHAAGEVVLFDTKPQTDDEKVARAARADVLVHSRGQVTWPGDVLRQLPNLKLIATCSIGTDSVDLDACREMGITVCNVPGETATIVAEHAIGLLFATARRLAWRTSELKSGRWPQRMDVTLHRKTLGIIGTGNIGCEVARLGSAIGMRVLAWSFHPDDAKARRFGFEYVERNDLLARSDAISLHCKLTDDSRGLVGTAEIARMKRGALLINTARGAIVDTAALVSALHNGHLGGAGIDVYDEEPIAPKHPLLGCEQVVLTPHSADQTPEGIDALNGGCVENVLAFLAGRPRNVVV
jgi:phosphoglycerate dehydrogenase-like enzyme